MNMICLLFLLYYFYLSIYYGDDHLKAWIYINWDPST